MQSLPRPVILTADPALMDPEYLATCMHRAACQNLKDADLWKGYVGRFIEISDQVEAGHFGYLCWAVGKVQLPPQSGVHEALVSRGLALAPSMSGSGLMALLWTLRRAIVKPPHSLLQITADRILNEPEKIRPSDFIRICNSLAFFGFGKNDHSFRDKISNAAMAKFEADTFAQDFREAVDPIALANLWNDEMRGYVLERFRKVFITARPNHLLKAYHSSVAVRVLAPQAWYHSVSEKTRGFYTSLAMRHIATPGRGMSKFHQSVSDLLAEAPFRLAHRNMFRWGPFFIDIGFDGDEEDSDVPTLPDDRKRCILLDKPSSFYTNEPSKYTEKSRLEHLLLTEVGWDVVHLHHRAWKQSRTAEAKVALLRSVLEAKASDRL